MTRRIQNKLKPIELKNKILRIIYIAVTLSLSAISITIIFFAQNAAMEYIINDLQITGKVLGNRTIAALIFNDQEAAEKNLSQAQHQTSIHKVCFYALDGSLFAEYISPEIKSTRENNLDASTTSKCDKKTIVSQLTIDNSSNMLTIKMPVYDNNEMFGSITLFHSKSEINSLVMQIIYATCFAALLILGIAGYFIKRTVQKTLVPLDSLYLTSIAIAENPFSRTRARRQSDDQIGKLVDVFNTMLDTIATKNAALAFSERRFRVLADNAPIGIYLKNAQGHYEYVNNKWLHITQLPFALTQEEYIQHINHDDAYVYRQCLLSILNNQEAQVIEYHFNTGNSGSSINTCNKRILMEHIAPLMRQENEDAENKEFIGYVGSLMDITELKNTQLELENMAFYDPLTNLPNRRYFKNHLDQSINRCKISGTKLAVMMLDLDNFKKINDSLGHESGDELLVILAERLKNEVSKEDVVSRMGGDEFMIIIKNVQSAADISHIAERLLKATRKPINLRGHKIESSISIGIALYPDDSILVDDLIRNADLALYNSKSKNRNCYSFFSSELDLVIKEKMNLEQKLRHALQHNLLSIHLQPQWDIHQSKFIAGEALLRWHDTDHGFIEPERFIPIAEETGLIVNIGNWVIEHVCETIADNRKELDLIGIKTMTINLSARQFFDDSLYKTIENALADYNIEPERLEFEITESIMAKDINTAVSVIKSIHTLGCSISIDDFGTGYSSLAYLKIFSIDKIKIDKSFVKDIPHDKNDVEICAAIIAMAQNLGLEVVAEGVEDASQTQFFIQKKCNLIQGFYFAKPLPVSEFISKLPSISQQALLLSQPSLPIKH